jgi:hypothetical protein
MVTGMMSWWSWVVPKKDAIHWNFTRLTPFLGSSLFCSKIFSDSKESPVFVFLTVKKVMMLFRTLVFFTNKKTVFFQ